MFLENFDMQSIQDVEQARRAIVMLFNLLEDLTSENRNLQAEVQRLRDENNRLKGEQGKPDITPNTRQPDEPAGSDPFVGGRAPHAPGTAEGSYTGSHHD
jgi:FtsZ-binding cell division protein ZapB